MTIFEKCSMAATVSPTEWPVEIVDPSHGLFGASMFGNSQIPMHRDFSMSLIDALVSTGLCESNTLARTAIKGNAVMINRVKCQDINRILTNSDALPNLDAIVIEKGKRNFGIIELCDENDGILEKYLGLVKTP